MNHAIVLTTPVNRIMDKLERNSLCFKPKPIRDFCNGWIKEMYLSTVIENKGE